ncbi:MAG: L,D-transpeptidase [Thermoleophilia bacterium]|jgi:lipoprotein-anchoring transpeptidase ErfK/SrfK
MSRATTIQHQGISSPSAKKRAVIVIALSVLAVAILAYISMAAIFPPAVKIDPSPGSNDVPVDSQLKVSTSWLRGSIKDVSVKEISLDPTGASMGVRDIEGSLKDGIFVTTSGEPLLRTDSRYDITVNGELTDLTLTGPQTRDVTEHASFQTIITPAPIFTKELQVVQMGEPIAIEFNTPIESFSYEINPQLSSSSHVDETNPTKAFIVFDGYEQGQKYDLTITGAIASNGANLQHPYTQKVATTNPLKVVFVPGDGESGVSLGERPSLNFSEEIRNPELAESLLAVEPSTLGAWDWVAPDKVEFKPLQNWTQGAKITIRLKGGTNAFRSKSGSFLRQDVESSFTTKPSKMIDVDLTAQRVTLFDNDQQVKTMTCSSGSLATPSLTGTYAVYAKAEKIDMRGEGYVAPNVPWVLMFNGDYTIHGNYWATSFGTPTSHGCVGLPLPDAEYLYNWTPIGTIVAIHY